MSKSYDEYSEEHLIKRIKELETILSDAPTVKHLAGLEKKIMELEKDCIRPCPLGSETESVFMAGRMLACEVRAELKEWKVAAGAEAHEADKLREINKELEKQNHMLSAEISGIINAPDCEEECVPIETLKIKNAKLKADAERMKRLEINLNDQLQKEGNEVFCGKQGNR